MKKLIYVLMAVAALYSCNSNSTSTTESSSTAADSSAAAVNAIPPATPPATPEMPAEPVPGNAGFAFEVTEHDFGKITADHPVEYTFKFKNNGTEPLIISDARGSCGCTVPQYSREPVAVGADGEIQVSFDPKGKSGIQRKTVTITANTNPARTTLNIVSDVQGGETPPAAQ